MPHLSLKMRFSGRTIFFGLAGARRDRLWRGDREPAADDSAGAAVGGSLLALGTCGDGGAAGGAAAGRCRPWTGSYMEWRFVRAVRGVVAGVAMAVLLRVNAVGSGVVSVVDFALPFVAGIDLYLRRCLGGFIPVRTPWWRSGLRAGGDAGGGAGQRGRQYGVHTTWLVSMESYLLHSDLFLFAAMAGVAEAARGAGGASECRVGKRSHGLATLGFVSTALTIVLSVIPGDEEPNKPLAGRRCWCNGGAGGGRVVVFGLRRGRGAAAARRQ